MKRARDGALGTISIRASNLCALWRGLFVICRSILLLIELEIRREKGVQSTEGMVGTGTVRAKVVLYSYWICQLSLVRTFSWDRVIVAQSQIDHWISYTMPQVIDLLVDSIFR